MINRVNKGILILEEDKIAKIEHHVKKELELKMKRNLKIAKPNITVNILSINEIKALEYHFFKKNELI